MSRCYITGLPCDCQEGGFHCPHDVDYDIAEEIGDEEDEVMHDLPLQREDA